MFSKVTHKIGRSVNVQLNQYANWNKPDTKEVSMQLIRLFTFTLDLVADLNLCKYGLTIAKLKNIQSVWPFQVTRADL